MRLKKTLKKLGNVTFSFRKEHSFPTFLHSPLRKKVATPILWTKGNVVWWWPCSRLNKLQIDSIFYYARPRRLLEIHQIGLLDYWESKLRPMPSQCMKNLNMGDNTKNNSPSDGKHRRLSLKNLSGAFVVLAVGFCLSLFAFLVEIITFLANRTITDWTERKLRNMWELRRIHTGGFLSH